MSTQTTPAYRRKMTLLHRKLSRQLTAAKCTALNIHAEVRFGGPKDHSFQRPADSAAQDVKEAINLVFQLELSSTMLTHAMFESQPATGAPRHE